MSRPRLSIVIPTRNRVERLAETLDAIAGESFDGLEVIVVDDGSSDGTAELLETRDCRPFELVCDRQPGRGPAAARNRGIAQARASRVLLLGDDTRPAPGCLGGHHTDLEVGIQGRIEWDPQAPTTDVMRFLAPAGPQFYFEDLDDGGPVPFTAVLGSNFSAPTPWFRDEPYDESFPHAAFEDTELAWRWVRRGWVSHYRASTLAWHHHHYASLEPFLDRQRRAGRSARYAIRKHPRMLWPTVLQPSAFAAVVALRWLVGRSGPRGRRELGWDLRSRAAFFGGFAERPPRPRNPAP